MYNFLSLLPQCLHMPFTMQKVNTYPHKECQGDTGFTLQCTFVLVLWWWKWFPLSAVYTPGVSTPTSCATSVHLNSTIASTRDPPYACCGEQLVFNCVVVDGVALQWVSNPGIPCDDPITFTSGDDEGQRKTRNGDEGFLFQSYLTSLMSDPPSSNLTSNLTFTPPPSVNSVAVVCEDEHGQSSCCNAKDESTVIITGECSCTLNLACCSSYT